jgi:hypothetical protein
MVRTKWVLPLNKTKNIGNPPPVKGDCRCALFFTKYALGILTSAIAKLLPNAELCTVSFNSKLQSSFNGADYNKLFGCSIANHIHPLLTVGVLDG